MVRDTNCICGRLHCYVLGIGQSAALKYSELGYTVFALCPDHQRGISVTTRGPSGVSSASDTSYTFCRIYDLTLVADSVFLASKERAVT